MTIQSGRFRFSATRGDGGGLRRLPRGSETCSRTCKCLMPTQGQRQGSSSNAGTRRDRSAPRAGRRAMDPRSMMPRGATARRQAAARGSTPRCFAHATESHGGSAAGSGFFDTPKNRGGHARAQHDYNCMDGQAGGMLGRHRCLRLAIIAAAWRGRLLAVKGARSDRELPILESFRSSTSASAFDSSKEAASLNQCDEVVRRTKVVGSVPVGRWDHLRSRPVLGMATLKYSSQSLASRLLRPIDLTVPATWCGIPSPLSCM